MKWMWLAGLAAVTFSPLLPAEPQADSSGVAPAIREIEITSTQAISADPGIAAMRGPLRPHRPRRFSRSTKMATGTTKATRLSMRISLPRSPLR